ncbi:hypothetical protein ACIRBX_04915 [Kitasatospora sp. NPDC096147]|uniref:hypothetical protein n=1 Tax=Kitasatospora sp. NPDC096147 TaxID=3364093 RepID=UPI0038203837
MGENPCAVPVLVGQSTAVHLQGHDSPDGYRMHDLVRLYAAARWADELAACGGGWSRAGGSR